MIDVMTRTIKSLLGFSLKKSEAENQKVENEIISAEDMYTPLSIAKEEIWRRWNDKELMKRVEDFVGEVPSVFKDKPKAVIFRNIATPNFELQIAQEYAYLLGLDLVVVEYTADKFCTRNRDKLHLGKMMFFDNKCKSQVIAKENIISIKEQDNKCFRDIDTIWGENLVLFHHRIFKKAGFEKVEFFDAAILKEKGLSPYEIYLEILGFCIGNAVLLENFLIKADKGEAKFTEQIIIPAFTEVMNKAGHKPLIIPLLGCDGEGNICWQYYPDKIKESMM